MNQSPLASFKPHFDWLTSWMIYSWPNWVLILIALLIVINPLPLQARSIDTTSVDFLLIWTRRISLLILFCLVILLPPYVYLIYGLVKEHGIKDLNDELKWIRSFLWSIFEVNGLRFTLGLVLAILFKLTYQRYVAPPLSHFLHSIRIKTVSDRLSDVRDEIGKLKRKYFDPADYYQPEKIFFGLDEHNEPLYTDMDTFRKTNTQIIGPTRFGKGVLLGCLLDQAIRLGKHATIYVDPKDDEFVPWIMWHAAGADKRFTMVDLSIENKGTWAPFMGGNPRERRARIISACGLYDAGTDADFYKRQERGILDRILEKSNGSIPSLLNGLEAADTDGTPLREKAGSLYEGLRELSRVPALNTTGGLQVEQVLRNGWVLYFRGNINDRLLLLATRIFIMEVIQLSMRMREERAGQHLTFAVDELKFLVSKQLSDALATSLGANVNMIVMHQTLEDLRAPEDRTLDALAVQKSVEINCQLKVIYKCDPVTAEYASKASGTKMVKTPRQKMRINEFGGEVYQSELMVMEKDEGLIPENVLLSLPPMVGIFYSPHELAKVTFTAPVPTVKGDDLFKLNPLYKAPPRPPKESRPEIKEAAKEVKLEEGKPIQNETLKESKLERQEPINKPAQQETPKESRPEQKQTMNKPVEPKPTQQGMPKESRPEQKQTMDKPIAPKPTQQGMSKESRPEQKQTMNKPVEPKPAQQETPKELRPEQKQAMNKPVEPKPEQTELENKAVTQPEKQETEKSVSSELRVDNNNQG